MRSARRRATVLAQLTNLPLPRAPSVDELSRHRQQVAQTVLPFVTSTLRTIGLWQSSSLWRTVESILAGCIDLHNGLPIAHLNMKNALDEVNQTLATKRPDSLLVFCLMQPYLLWHLRYKGPAVSKFLGIYINHIADLVEIRVGRQHPIMAFMMGLRYVYQQAGAEWSSFTGPLISEVDVALMQRLDEISTRVFHETRRRLEEEAWEWNRNNTTPLIVAVLDMPSLSRVYTDWWDIL